MPAMIVQTPQDFLNDPDIGQARELKQLLEDGGKTIADVQQVEIFQPVREVDHGKPWKSLVPLPYMDFTLTFTNGTQITKRFEKEDE